MCLRSPDLRLPYLDVSHWDLDCGELLEGPGYARWWKRGADLHLRLRGVLLLIWRTPKGR
jgi:hypothetical protein